MEDAEEIAAGLVSDCDGNGVPDPCPVRSEIRFLEPTRYPAGAYSGSIVSGDFDGDGRVDLATANAVGGDVTVLWNQGDRRFLSAEGIPVASAPVAIEAADIDRDGDVDLLVAVPGASAVAVLANDGSRTFSAARTVSAGGAVQGVRARDIDGDGWEDLAVLLKTGIEIAWGEGPGVLGEARTVLQTDRPKDAAIADLDRDSILDVIAMQNVKLSIFFQRRSRFFVKVEHPLSASSSSLLLADLNGDGALDLVGNEGQELRVFLNDGHGGFPGGASVGSPFAVRATALLASDIDLDGDADILAGSCDGGSVSVALNDGSGRFLGPRHYALRNCAPLVSGDLDGDGWIDLATTYPWRHEVSILWGEGAGELGAPPMYFGPSTLSGRPAAGDVDGDGLPELFVCTSSGVSVYKQVRGRMVAAWSAEVPGGTRRIAIADFTGDGRLDLAVLTGESRASVLLSRGDGTFEPPRVASYPVAGWVLATGDVNEDGLSDLVVADDHESTYKVLGSLGDGSFAALSQARPFANSPALALGDIDADGHVDMIFDAEGSLYVLRGDGRGRFSPWQRQEPQNGFEALDLADLDGDGDLDIVATNGFHVAVWFTGEGGSLGGPVRIPAGDNNRSQALADLEDDGDLDVVVVSAGSDEAIVLVNEGGGTLRLSDHVLEVGPDPLDVATFDANADGLPDFAFRGLNSLGFVAVLNRSVRGVFDANRNGVPDSCEVPFHRGDADGDGLLSVADAQFVISYVLYGTAAPACMAAADGNGDRRVDISDGIFVLNYLFRGKAPPPSPGPPPGGCGMEPGGEEEARPALGCERYERC
ncbi:MAG: FG-GAP-like repeat-containing protein [Planctomycetota bacterium]